MIYVEAGACLSIITLIALIAIPADVRSMMADNCRGSKGQIKIRYVCRELRALASFYLGLLVVALLTGLCVFLGIGYLAENTIVLEELFGAVDSDKPSRQSILFFATVFMGIVTFLRLSDSYYTVAFNELVDGAIKRDRERVKRRYFQNTAQAKLSRQMRKERERQRIQS